MREVYYLTKRNCLLYLRDKSAVFFSMLSMLIVLGLMVIFLGNMNSEAVLNIIETYGNRAVTEADRENAAYLIQMWTLAGILLVNAVTVTLTVLGGMVVDETQKRIMAFYVTPVKRLYLALGYILSAWMIGSGMCLLTLGAGELYFIGKGFGALPLQVLLKLAGMIVCNAFTFSALGYMIALFVHSNSAWSGILTIIGTLVGFAGGIYLPMGELSESVGNILKCFPILHGAAMMRETATAELVEKTFAGMPAGLIPIYKEEMGITVTMNGQVLDVKWQMVLLFAYAAAAIVIAVFVTGKRKLKDR